MSRRATTAAAADRRPVVEDRSLYEDRSGTSKIDDKDVNEATLTIKKKRRKKSKAQLRRERTWKTEWTKPSRTHPYAYVGAEAFVQGTHHKVRRVGTTKKGSATRTKQAQREWLEEQDTYQMHRPARVRYPRRLFGPVYGIDDQWQMDLSDMQRDDVKRANDGAAWILFAIDVLSRKAWAVPLKRKSGPETAAGIRLLFDHVMRVDSDHTIPRTIYVDKGTEFYNKDVKAVLQEYPIPPVLMSGYSTTKAAIVERLQRTIKGQLWKHFYDSGSYRWVDVLPNLMDAYNARKHRSIKRAPNEVTRANEEEVFKTLYPNVSEYRERTEGLPMDQQHRLYEFQVGDAVRVSKQAQLFDKKYLPRWSEELFRVRARDPGPPPYYRLREWRDGGEDVRTVRTVRS